MASWPLLAHASRHAVIDTVSVGGDKNRAGLRHGERGAAGWHGLSASFDGNVGKRIVCACPCFACFVASGPSHGKSGDTVKERDIQQFVGSCCLTFRNSRDISDEAEA